LQQVAAKAESAPTPSKPPAKPKPKPHPKVVNETSAKPVIENKPAATPPPAEERNAPTTAADAARLAASTRKEREAAKSARAEMLAAAAEAAREDAAKGSPPAGVKLFIVSDPLGASVTAAWSGKSAAGTTPIVFRVRRGAAITVSFSKPGYAPQVREIAAREAQAVAVELRPIP
jgi:outer membrane biosynthesis protein TonB